MTPPDCAWKNGSTQLDGTKAPPDRCMARGCDGTAKKASGMSCYLPIDEPPYETSSIPRPPSHHPTLYYPRELITYRCNLPRSESEGESSERSEQNTRSLP